MKEGEAPKERTIDAMRCWECVIAGAAARETAEIGKTDRQADLISFGKQSSIHIGKHFREACIITYTEHLFRLYLHTLC